jgi:hypothetical protein
MPEAPWIARSAQLPAKRSTPAEDDRGAGIRSDQRHPWVVLGRGSSGRAGTRTRETDLPNRRPGPLQRQRGLLTWDGPPNLPANDSTRPRQQPRAAAEVDAEEKQRKPPLAEQMQQRTDAAMDPAIVKAEAFGLSEPDQGPPMGPWTRQPLGFRRFLLRGLGKANGPWGLC